MVLFFSRLIFPSIAKMQLYSLRSLATDSNNDLDMVTDGLRPFVDSLCEKGSKKSRVKAQ